MKNSGLMKKESTVFIICAMVKQVKKIYLRVRIVF